MKTTLNWKRKFFRSTYNIFSENSQVGELKEKSWSSSAEGELNGNRYGFKTKGFFKLETEIIDLNTNTVIGKINSKSFKTDAKIVCSDKVFYWKYTNGWGTKWSISDSENVQIEYRGSSSKGKMEIAEQNDLLVLVGLYLINNNSQIVTVVMIIFLFLIWGII